MSTLAEKLDALPVLDDLQRTENPLSNGGKWEATWFAANIGKATATGWVTTTSNVWAAAGWINLAYAAPCASLATLGVRPGTNGHNVGLSLFGTTNKAGAESGLQARVQREGATKYYVYIGYYEAGTFKELVNKVGVALADGDRLALSFDAGEEKGCKLSRKPAAGAWETLISVATSEVPTGKLGTYAGVLSLGSADTTYRVTNFAAGSLKEPAVIEGTAAGTGTGAGTAAGIRTRFGAGTGTGTGSETAAGTRTRLGSGAGTGTGAGAAAGTRTRLGVGTGVGVGTGSATGQIVGLEGKPGLTRRVRTPRTAMGGRT